MADFHVADFPPGRLSEAKGARHVSVCLPAKDEEATVGAIVESLGELRHTWGLVDEVLVVDDASVDRTATVAADTGATVVSAADVGTGKGEALAKAVAVAKGDLLVFCDADIRHFDPSFVTGLLGPLLVDDRIAFVKAAYERPEGGGRVTELVARPLISRLFPELVGFRQPLAGEFAARRELLEAVPFASGYGVDIGLLIDVVRLVGLDRVAQVDLDLRFHRNRPLLELRAQAEAVIAVALDRAGRP
jgi:glucosyl-3-phosphoglycerate synthase